MKLVLELTPAAAHYAILTVKDTALYGWSWFTGMRPYWSCETVLILANLISQIEFWETLSSSFPGNSLFSNSPLPDWFPHSAPLQNTVEKLQWVTYYWAQERYLKTTSEPFWSTMPPCPWVSFDRNILQQMLRKKNGIPSKRKRFNISFLTVKTKTCAFFLTYIYRTESKAWCSHDHRATFFQGLGGLS